jgi:27-O-demethylrifamycin SV methyltransferase
VLRRDLPFAEVRRLREPLALLRDVFGDARMEPLSTYRALAEEAGLEVDVERDLTAETRATFARWRENAERHAGELEELLGAEDRDKFAASCDVLEGFWDDGTLGYGLLAGSKR